MYSMYTLQGDIFARERETAESGILNKNTTYDVIKYHFIIIRFLVVLIFMRKMIKFQLL
jgi:hypothetical protein